LNILRRHFLTTLAIVATTFTASRHAASNESTGTDNIPTEKPRTILPFGDIDKENVEVYYGSEMLINGLLTDVDLNFESASVDASVLQSVSDFISKIDLIALKASNAITDDYDLGEDSDTARFYLKHHTDILSEEELVDLFGTTKITKELFLNALTLYRVGFYPEDDDSFAIFDIQFSREVTDYLMAVTFDVNGKLSYISMES